MSSILGLTKKHPRKLTKLSLKACESYGYDDFNGTYNTLCYQSLNASNPIYLDLTVDNPGNRQWNWLLCNEP